MTDLTIKQALEQAKEELKKLFEQGDLSAEDYQTSLAALEAEQQPTAAE